MSIGIGKRKRTESVAESELLGARSNEEVDNLQVWNRESYSFRSSALGVKKFFCDLCDFASYFEQTLLDHRLSDHEGGLPHSCQRCLQKFKEKADVEHHILVEHLHPTAYWKSGRSQPASLENNEYVCGECGSNFDRKDHLVKHMRLHTLHKQCKCVLCEVLFFILSSLDSIVTTI